MSDTAHRDGLRAAWDRVLHEVRDPDPLLDDLARLLADPRIPDAYVGSVRACIREHCYQMRLVLKEQAA